MYPQNAFNLITEIADSKLENLRETLAEVKKDVEDNPYFNFNKIISIHFARFVILDEVRNSAGKLIYPAYLTFESNYDGGLDDHLNDIVAHTKENNGFDKIFSACKKFPTSNSITDTDRINFLKTDSHFHPYFYRGTWGRTVSQIRAEEQTRSEIEEHLDKNDLHKLSEEEIYKKLKETIKPSMHKTVLPPKMTTVIALISPLLLGILYTIIYGLYYGLGLFTSRPILLFLPTELHFLIIKATLGIILTIVIAVAVFLMKVRSKEKSDEELNILYDPNPDTESLRTAEDRIVQNQLTHLVELKEGSFRLFTLKLVLFAIEKLAIYKFNKGDLGGIPSIHFARWIIIDKGKRLLFYSNFDGSWENYLGDFIDRAAVGLTAVWSNTKLFPTTRFLILDGATNEQKFKSWTRMRQIPTQVWYSAYKYLTVENINNNTAVTEGLKRNDWMTEKELKDWLIKL